MFLSDKAKKTIIMLLIASFILAIVVPIIAAYA